MKRCITGTQRWQILTVEVKNRLASSLGLARRESESRPPLDGHFLEKISKFSPYLLQMLRRQQLARLSG